MYIFHRGKLDQTNLTEEKLINSMEDMRVVNVPVEGQLNTVNSIECPRSPLLALSLLHAPIV